MASIHTAEVVSKVLRAGRARVWFDTEPLRDSNGLIFERVTDWQAVFTERDLLVEVAASFPEGATSNQASEATREVLQAGLASGELVPLPDHGTDHRWVLTDETPFTTRTQLEREQSVLAAAHEVSPVRVDLAEVELAAMARELAPEQVSAVRRLGEHDGRLVAVAGPGGSGKTYAISAYADAARAESHPVIGVAPTATAAQKLAEDLRGHWTGTIAMLTHHVDSGGENLLPGTVVICDEASMVSTKDLARLTELVRDCDGKLILLGDPQQLPSIESGGLFHRIVADGHAVVTDLAAVNRRQRHELDRRALHLLRSGEVYRAVFDYTEAGRIHIGHERLDAMVAMVDAWWNDTRVHGLEAVRMLAGRRGDIEMLNHLARTRMQAEGLLTGPALETRMGMTLQVGDRIVVRANWYSHRDLRNGQTGTVTAVDPATRALTFRRDYDGVEVDVPRRYVDQSVDYGYAQTIHTAQGHTYKRAHVYIDQTMTGEHGYTGLSRASGETHIWTADLPGPLGDCPHVHGLAVVEDRTDSLVRQFSRTGVRPSAADHSQAIELLTDQQLVDRRGELALLISQSPLGRPRPDIEAIDAAMYQAQAAVDRLGTSGAHRQLETLTTQRREALSALDHAVGWIEDNASQLEEYEELTLEFDRRVTARAVLYRSDPPEDLLATLGPRAEAADPKAWDAAVTTYARARIEAGPDVDLNDPAIHHTGPWRDAIHQLRLMERSASVLKLTG